MISSNGDMFRLAGCFHTQTKEGGLDKTALG